MVYPFVEAANDYGPREGPVLALVVHMAEGGNTVAYLAGSPARGVSVHFVIEYSGRIVRMLHDDHASGSINPDELRTTNDLDGLYGITAAVEVMGGWARDPNAACLSVEIEGLAAVGPNSDQAIALEALVRDLRATYPAIGLLGHRDFQDYKACPGHRIPWALIGGHGEADMTPVAITDEQPALIDVATGADWYDLDNFSRLGAGVDAPLAGYPSPYGVGTIGAGGRRAIIVTLKGLRRVVLVTPTAVRFPPPVVSCDDVVQAELERAAERAAVAVRTRP
jgi:hypothetical protein